VRALGLLARREHARGELEFKLASGGVEADAIRRVLDALEARGLLSEERFAEQFVRSRRNRGQGPRRIREELRRRGIGDAAATEALGQDDEYCPNRRRRRGSGVSARICPPTTASGPARPASWKGADSRRNRYDRRSDRRPGIDAMDLRAATR
jgi:hypothetical protein